MEYLTGKNGKCIMEMLAIVGVIFGVLGFVFGIIGTLVAVYSKGKIDATIKLVGAMESKKTVEASSQQRGAYPSSHASNKPDSSSAGNPKKVPETPPQAIAPNIGSPPKPKGGFGKRTGGGQGETG